MSVLVVGWRRAHARRRVAGSARAPSMRVTETRGRPRSRTRWSSPWRAAWSAIVAAEDGASVALVADGQSIEPGGPMLVEVARQPDLVAARASRSTSWVVFGHVAPLACCRRCSGRRCRARSRDDKVGADVMSAHHHDVMSGVMNLRRGQRSWLGARRPLARTARRRTRSSAGGPGAREQAELGCTARRLPRRLFTPSFA